MSGDIVHYPSIELDMTVSDLKERISNDPYFETPEPYRIRLFVEEGIGYNVLNDSAKTLESYGIEKGRQVEIFIDDPIIDTYHGSIGADIEVKESGCVCVIGDNLYMTDRKLDSVSIFRSDGEFIRRFGSGDGQFNYPSGICCDQDGTLYVADSGNHRIQVFDSSGRFVRTFGSIGKEESEFFYPSGVCVDSKGNLYVSDNGNHRIQVFSQNGTFLKAFGTKGSEDGQFLDPLGVCVDSKDHLYVADCGNDRVQVFDENGIFLRKNNFQHQTLTGLCVDESDNLYVFEARRHIIHVFDVGGTFLKKFRIVENDNIQEYGSGGICLDKENGNLYVSSFRNVQFFKRNT